MSSNLSDEDFILSLNPDDPISQKDYMNKRGIIGVPFDVVKKLMINEQKKLLKGESKDLTIKENSVQNIEKPPTSSSDSVQNLNNTNNIQDNLKDNSKKQEDISNILLAIQKISEGFESNFGKLNNDLESLKKEIDVLKNIRKLIRWQKNQ